MIKTLKKVGIEGTWLNVLKDTYDKPTAHIILNAGKLKAFARRPGTRQGYLHLPLSLNIVMKILATASRQEKEIKSIQIRNRGVKLFLFSDDMMLYLENPPSKKIYEN